MNKHWTYGALLSIAVLVSACGGSSNSMDSTASNGGAGNGGTTQPTPTAPATPMDAFTKAVAAFIASFSDTTEPAALDTTPASAPEDMEPVSVS